MIPYTETQTKKHILMRNKWNKHQILSRNREISSKIPPDLPGQAILELLESM